MVPISDEIDLASRISRSDAQYLALQRQSDQLFQSAGKVMQRLGSLSVPFSETSFLLDEFENLPFKQIRTLQTFVVWDQFDRVLKSLGEFFPSLEHLSVIEITSMSQINFILARFPRLSSVTLCLSSSVSHRQLIDFVERWTQQPVSWQLEHRYAGPTGWKKIYL